MKVRAIRTGYYDHMRRRGDDTMGDGNGDVFTLFAQEITVVDVKTQAKTGTRMLTPEDQFSERWMVKVDDDTPEHTTGSGAALGHVTTDLKEARRPGRSRKESTL